jgi:hypothetical protein
MTGGVGFQFNPGTTARTDLGTGGGAFGIPNNLGFFVTDFGLGDMNGDGKVDLIAVEVPGLTIRLGDGLGHFGKPVSVGYIAGGAHFTLGDFNLDGALDVVAGTTANPFLQVSPAIFLGDGKGNLKFIGNIPGRGVFLATGDVDGDGKPDVVTTYSSAPPKLRAFLGNGAGGFTAQSEASAGGFVDAGPVVLGLVDGNGFLDAMTRGGDAVNQTTASVLLGNGLGGFALDAAASFLAPGAPNFAIGDINGDGLEDLVATTDTGSAVIARLATGPGVFADPITLAIPGNPTACVLTDLDSTGRLDAVLATPGALGFTVLLNQLPFPIGVFLFGTGTPGCVGIQGIAPIGEPKAGNLSFGISNTNGPPSSLGLFVVTDKPDIVGHDSLGIGVILHVDLLGATTIGFFDGHSDPTGYGVGHAPIPNNPAIVGKTFYAQGLWAWTACKPSSLSLSSSRGMGFLLH